ncbi:Response regulator receiver protein [Kangiella geojedonensis]|uniref:Response regulator receiver protein n=1 Tax=Kangiella geojedonensis TaxID=914150 RepID=A0A0F6RCW8_9GAMM|nr:response regulator [Kangiella geojedonensis]AKE52391.1 Response regulator receiver protein [Kangiella geojedonensis]
MSLLDKIRSSLTSGRIDNTVDESANQDERRRNKRVNARPGTKMLIIDDSKTVCTLLKKMLVQNQYEVGIALDGEAGLKLAKEHQPGLIFLDIVLPGINGFQVLRQLRKDPKTKNIPVIMISGNVLATEKYYAERIGADDFMKKPFSRYEVFHRIENFIGVDKRIRRIAS